MNGVALRAVSGLTSVLQAFTRAPIMHQLALLDRCQCKRCTGDELLHLDSRPPNQIQVITKAATGQASAEMISAHPRARFGSPVDFPPSKRKKSRHNAATHTRTSLPGCH